MQRAGTRFKFTYTFAAAGSYPVTVKLMPAGEAAVGAGADTSPQVPSLTFGPVPVQVVDGPRTVRVQAITLGVGVGLPGFLTPTTVLMEPSEISTLFAALQSPMVSRFLEFGGGGSTAMAATVPTLDAIVTVESDAAFLRSLMDQPAIAQAHAAGRWTPVPVDIGATQQFGYPVDTSRRHAWPRFAAGASNHGPQSFQVIFIDGRFRVACALEALRLLAPGGVVFVHDYPFRPHYHAVTQWYDVEAVVNELAVLRPKRGVPLPTMEEVMAFSYDMR